MVISGVSHAHASNTTCKVHTFWPRCAYLARQCLATLESISLPRSLRSSPNSVWSMQPDLSKSALQKTNSKIYLATAIAECAPVEVWMLPLILLLLILPPLLPIMLPPAASPPLLSYAADRVVVVVVVGVPAISLLC